MKLVKFSIFIIVLSLLVGLVGGCQPQPAGGAFTDDLGREINIDYIPQRIISLSPSNTEILFALGLGDRVVGVTEYCNYPEEAQTKPKVGGFSTVDIEKIVALEPDLILAGNIHAAKIIPRLEQLGLTVVALAPKTLERVLANISLVGEINGQTDEANHLVSSLEKRIKAITDQTDLLSEKQRPKVFYLTWHDPLLAAGSGTLHDHLIDRAGGVNIAHDLTGYADISLEAVVEANPEVIIAGVGMGTGEDLPFQFVQTEPRLQETEARQHNRVYPIDVDLVGRPGPRVVDALEEFAKFIHPELFEEVH
jgi:iron complex transport system substrate-binding protein